MVSQPNYDKFLDPIADVTTSIETLLDGAFGNLMGDQREVLKRTYSAAWGFHTLLLEIVTNLGIENVAKRAYLPAKFDQYITPMIENSKNLMLGLDGPLSDEQRIAVEFINVTGLLMRRYIDNVWLYSQLSNDLYHLNRQPTTIEDVVDPMHWSITTYPVELEVLVPEEFPLIQVDADLMRSAIMQLVENAISNTREGSIRVLVALQDNALVVTVIDTGCGIPIHHQQDIFLPFFQVRQDDLGLGLGLCIAQRAALMHKGYLQVDTLDNRTTALMRIPL